MRSRRLWGGFLPRQGAHYRHRAAMLPRARRRPSEAPMHRFGSALCRPWVTAAAFCLVVPIVASGEDPEPEKISVKIRPVVLFAGRDVRATVRTPRHPRNRELRIVVEGADYFA